MLSQELNCPPIMDTNWITVQNFLLRLSLHTSIIKHNTTYPHPPQKGIGQFRRKMEQNFPAMAKRFWQAIRVAYFMLRKNISKPKLLADLNLMMKRGKIAGKAAMHNLVFHHHGPGGDSAGTEDPGDRQIPPDEYESSCSNTPARHAFRLPFRLNKRKRSPSPSRAAEDPEEEELFAAAMEVFGARDEATPSPLLPGFGRTPMVRQLRVTDSPFPVMEAEEDDGRVDEAAERFIRKFYRDLKRQNTMPA